MKLTKAIQKAEKLSGKIIEKNGQFYSVHYRGYTVQFACNGRLDDDSEATNYYSIRNNAKDDIQTDYFAGTFHNNLTQAFKFIDETLNRGEPIPL